jgi:hypothetical protein
MVILNPKMSMSGFIKKLFISCIIVSLVLNFSLSFSQCCSTGSPVGASIYVGVLNKNSFRFNLFYRHSYSDTYFQGNSKTEEGVILNFSSYNFTGLSFSYGIARRLTAEADFGYFIDKTQDFKYIDYQEKGHGLSNGGLTFKYAAYIRPLQQIEFTLGAGFRFPFTFEPQEVDGVRLSRDVQPSTNSFGLNAFLFFNKGFNNINLRLFTINRFEYNFEDHYDYQYGPVVLNSIFVSKRIVPRFFGVLQVRSEYRGKDKDQGETRDNSGNYLLVLSPQLSYSIAGKWNITLVYDQPIYKNYQGKQLTPKYSIALGLSRDLDFSKKDPVVIQQ